MKFPRGYPSTVIVIDGGPNVAQIPHDATATIPVVGPILVADADLALSLEREPAIAPNMWRAAPF